MFLYITVHLHLIASLSASSFSACFVEQNVGGGSELGMLLLCSVRKNGLELLFWKWNASFLVSIQSLHLAADVQILPTKRVQMFGTKFSSLG